MEMPGWSRMLLVLLLAGERLETSGIPVLDSLFPRPKCQGPPDHNERDKQQEGAKDRRRVPRGGQEREMSKPSSTESESIRDVPRTAGVMVATASCVLAKADHPVAAATRERAIFGVRARGSFAAWSEEHVEKLVRAFSVIDTPPDE
jgi:hypothetical protein